MRMNADSPTGFFARQERAQKNCRKLTAGFALAVLFIVGVTAAALRLIWYVYAGLQSHTLINQADAGRYRETAAAFSLFEPAAFLGAALLVLFVILAASFYKMRKLRRGGGAVALMLGGRLIDVRPSDADERRLVNVVEEMAVASGIPVPLVFVLDAEKSINAFAAGLAPSDAAIAVTQGALTKLTRDELQGVIAHEFSHILNGDMRLNLQAIGILYGILFLGIIGRQILRGGKYSARLGVVALLAGVALSGIGLIGTFLGRLLQCAISRNQERLADATAFQFTRNPLGLAGALKKIGGFMGGSRIASEKARQASHLFFGESHPNDFFLFLNTHPPLDERIRLLDPSFDGKYTKIAVDPEPLKIHPRYREAYRGELPGLPTGSPLWAAMPSAAAFAVGNPQSPQIQAASDINAAVPDALDRMLATPSGAASIIFALLMTQCQSTQRAAQEQALGRVLVLKGETAIVFHLCREMDKLDARFRLPLLELAMPSLRTLTGLEKRNFLLILDTLIAADRRVTLFELTASWILHQYLDDSRKLFSQATYFTFAAIGHDVIVLLAALARAGHPDDPDAALRAFQAGVAKISGLAAKNPQMPAGGTASYTQLDASLKKLQAASFSIKETIVSACAHCVFADRAVTPEEGELLRIVALALDCPLPPFSSVNDPEKDLIA